MMAKLVMTLEPRDDTGTQDDTRARDDSGSEDDTQATDDTRTADEAAPDAPAQDTPIAPAESATEVPASPQPTATITRVPPPQQSFTPVKAVINTPANLRLGPGTEFDLVGSISVNEEVEIVAVNAARDWYHIRYGDFGDAWIYSELVRPSGEVGAVPVDPGPAPPQPEVDNLPTSGVNLVIDKIIIVPEALVCNETGTVDRTRSQRRRGRCRSGWQYRYTGHSQQHRRIDWRARPRRVSAAARRRIALILAHSGRLQRAYRCRTSSGCDHRQRQSYRREQRRR